MGQTLRHPTLQKHAKKLRRDITKEEQILWQILRDRKLGGWKFRRQVTIEPFIVDFLCAELKLIVEIDGCTHDDRTNEDRSRDESLERRGFGVLRFWNEDVVYRENYVVQEIVKACYLPEGKSAA